MRASAIFGRAFLDGLTMAGFFERVDRPGAWELDPAKLLSSSSTKVDFEVFERTTRRSFHCAMAGLSCGFLALLAMLGSYVYLVMQAHPVLSGVVLGIWVLAIVGDFIWIRLNRRKK